MARGTNEVTGVTGNAALTDTDGRQVVVGPNGGAQLVAIGSGASATAAITSPAYSASSTTILASNANRRGASVYNDASAVLYLELGSAAASTTNHTIQMASGGYYEVPFGYTGQLTGIWAAGGSGAARVTELSA